MTKLHYSDNNIRTSNYKYRIYFIRSKSAVRDSTETRPSSATYTKKENELERTMCRRGKNGMAGQTAGDTFDSIRFIHMVSEIKSLCGPILLKGLDFSKF